MAGKECTKVRIIKAAEIYERTLDFKFVFIALFAFLWG